MKTLKIATQLPISQISLDPSLVLFAIDANLIRSMYSPLFEFTKDGKLTNGLAESYHFNENEIQIKLKKLKLSNGDFLSAEDVAVSLKRTIILDRNTHINLSLLIDCNPQIKKLNEHCPGIFIRGEDVVLKVKDKSMFPTLINSLALMDFVIIPSKSLNDNLEIVDHSLSTGPYSITTLDKINNIIKMKKNSEHFHQDSSMAKSVEYHYVPHVEIEKLFNEDKIDVIPTYYGLWESKIKNLKPELNIFTTAGIKSFVFHFTQRGVRNFSIEERLHFGYLIRKFYLERNPPPSTVIISEQFFPLLSEGALTENQKKELFKNILNAKDYKKHLKKKIVIGIEENSYDLFVKRFGDLEDFKIIKTMGVPWNVENRENVDLCISHTDTTFHDSISVIAYNLRSEFFGYTQEESNELISTYLKLNNESERLEYIRKIHFDVLNEGRVIPLGHAPYIAVSNKKWNLDLSKFYAGTPLWGIRYNEY